MRQDEQPASFGQCLFRRTADLLGRRNVRFPPLHDGDERVHHLKFVAVSGRKGDGAAHSGSLLGGEVELEAAHEVVIIHVHDRCPSRGRSQMKTMVDDVGKRKRHAHRAKLALQFEGGLQTFAVNFAIEMQIVKFPID